MLMDAMLGAKRTKPLIVAGPRELEKRLKNMCEALFPGMNTMSPKFDLQYIEMEIMRPNQVGLVTVTPFPAVHTGGTNPTSVRCEVDEKIISYTGDSAYNKHMSALGKNADLLILECYSFAKPIKFHLNYPDIKCHWDDFGAKRIILTHMSSEMLPMVDKISEETARDHMTVEI
tara:strand:+ start:1348 stop:1869 length:522 start_codon:yes stop_codon:yes gene_type:complete